LARTRKKKSKGRAARFLLLALLVVLIAGFIARREIPVLIHNAARGSADADTGGRRSLDEGRENLHSSAGGGLSANGGPVGGQPMVSPAGNDVQANGKPPGEHITSAERRQLDDLIKEKSR
jgi:hypothetical protein